MIYPDDMAASYDTFTLDQAMNTLSRFCGPRDIDRLSHTQLHTAFGFDQADIMVLFGGSIVVGGDVLAEGITKHMARNYIIVGGAGHTTEALRATMRELFPHVETDRLPEARIFQNYLSQRYGIHADWLEIESTNCGNNITYLLDLLEREHVAHDSMILVQDATMQRRMAAGMKKFAPDAAIVNYAAYEATVIGQNTIPDADIPRAGICSMDVSSVDIPKASSPNADLPDASGLTFTQAIPGMWNMSKYAELLLGEIERLVDSPNGYGPNGKNYIAHIDVPSAVLRAAQCIKRSGISVPRAANPQFA